MTDEEKGIFAEGFSESFIAFVNEWQELDARSINQPLYREKLKHAFSVMSGRFIARLHAHIGEPDTSKKRAVRSRPAGGVTPCGHTGIRQYHR
ncbi:hypothetical protein ABJ851_002865 [Shigella flexneri]|nr:hypothetical protein [Escherichia coli]